jgi:hypothetical protein
MKKTRSCFFIFAISIVILLSAYGDPRDQTDGTVQSLASYSVAAEIVGEGRIQLGRDYSRLALAHSAAEFSDGCVFLNGDQLSTVSSIIRQLTICITIIETQPRTRVANLADSLIQKNKGFFAELPQLLQRWQNARLRMPKP